MTKIIKNKKHIALMLVLLAIISLCFAELVPGVTLAAYATDTGSAPPEPVVEEAVAEEPLGDPVYGNFFYYWDGCLWGGFSPVEPTHYLFKIYDDKNDSFELWMYEDKVDELLTIELPGDYARFEGTVNLLNAMFRWGIETVVIKTDSVGFEFTAEDLADYDKWDVFVITLDGDKVSSEAVPAE